ncbi:hypothetical protein DFJ74DRAFT_4323 [Hyaloraphidium curvatum]|nr:hypothetical protein DFJ74DRAFT_4323 [Hyaloraphidium curvatum]
MAKGTAAPPSKAAPGKASKAATPAKPPAAPAKSPAKGRAEPKKRAASSSSGSSSDEDRAPQRPSQPVEVEESSSSSSSASDMEEVIEPQQPPPKGKQKQQPLVADVPVVTVRIDKEVSGGDKKGKPADKAKKGGVVPAPAPAPAPAAKPAPASKPAKPAAPAAAEKEKAKPAEKSKPAAKAPVKAASESSSSSSSSSEDEAEQEHEAPAAEVEAPHAAEADAKKRRGRPPGRRSKPKRDPDAPKRPGSAYTIFVQEKHAEVKARLEAELREEEAASGQEEEGGKSKVQKAVIGELGKIWKAMTDEEKEPYKEKASVEKALYEAKSKEYTDSGAKERWAAEHPKVDAKHPAPAATAAMFATPAPHVPVSTVNPALHAKLVRFAEEDGFEGANEIQAMIAALPTEQRNEAHRRFNYLLDYKRLRTVDQWVSQCTVPGVIRFLVAELMTPLPKAGHGHREHPRCRHTAPRRRGAGRHGRREEGILVGSQGQARGRDDRQGQAPQGQPGVEAHARPRPRLPQAARDELPRLPHRAPEARARPARAQPPRRRLDPHEGGRRGRGDHVARALGRGEAHLGRQGRGQQARLRAPRGGVGEGAPRVLARGAGARGGQVGEGGGAGGGQEEEEERGARGARGGGGARGGARGGGIAGAGSGARQARPRSRRCRLGRRRGGGRGGAPQAQGGQARSQGAEEARKDEGWQVIGYWCFRRCV